MKHQRNLLFATTLFILLISNTAALAQFGLGGALKNKAERAIKTKLKDKTTEKAASYDTLSFNYAIAFLDKTASYRNRQEGERLVKTANFMLNDGNRKTEQEELRDLFDVANISYSLGNYYLAETYLQAALLAGFNADSLSNPIYFKSLGLLGVIYNNMGRFNTAEDYNLRALDGWQNMQGEQSIGYLAELNNLAVLRMNEGNYLLAEELMTKLAKNLSVLKEDQPLPYAIYINNKAILNQYMGRSAEALKYMKDCISISEDKLSASNNTYLQFLTNQAILEQENGKLDTSEKTFLKVIELQSSSSKISKKSEDNLAHTKANIAALYVEKQEYDKAEKYLKEAYDSYKESKGVDNLETAGVQANLGNLYRYLDKGPEALSLLQKALDTREGKLSETHPKVIQNKEDIAIYYWQNNETEKAYEYFKPVMEISIEFIKTYFPALSEAEKTKYWESLKPRFFKFYNFATQKHQEKPVLLDDLISYRLATKGILLTASTALQQEIYNNTDPEIQTLYDEWIDLKQQLANVYALSEEQIQEQDINIESLERQVVQREKTLASKSQAFSKAFESRNTSLIKIQEKLKGNEVLIEVIQFPMFDKRLTAQSVYAYLVTKNTGKLQILVNTEGSELEGRYFGYYNNVIKQKFKDDYSYDKFFNPFAKSVVGKTKLIISPDGIYNQLNLNTLKSPSGKYLIEQYDIRYIGHPNDLLESKKATPKSGSTAFLLGNPAYGNSAIAQLPGTKKELAVISQYLKGQLTVQNYTEKQASEFNLKQANSPYVLHLASHGFFLEDDMLQNNLMGIQIQYIQQNPLLRSGLLLSGAATSEATGSSQSFNQADNGVFTAYEAINLNLENTEMVVLSACETARGDVKSGEGVYGLQRAFIIAGAQSIIMSLWKVDDAATQQLMTNFYKNRMSSKSVAEAFRNAQLTLMKQYKEPYYWGAFIMFSK